MKALLEVAVFIDKFRNVDLGQQGLYQLQVSVVCDKSSMKAQPINFQSVLKNSKKNDILPGTICEDFIRSQAFLVRYADEKVKIRELCEFYLEIDLSENTSNSSSVKSSSEHQKTFSLSVNIDLYYEELGTKLRNQSSLENDLRLSSSKTIKLASPLKGLIEYLPINFTGKWFSSVSSMIMVGFYDYKVPSSDLGVFASVLFADSKGLMKDQLSPEEIEEKFETFIQKLAFVHKYLKKRLEDISAACFIEDLDLPLSVRMMNFEDPEQAKNFTSELKCLDPVSVTGEMLKVIKTIAAAIYETFNFIKNTVAGNMHKVTKFLAKNYSAQLKDTFADFVRKEELGNSWKFDICSSEETKKDHKRKAKILRKSGYLKETLRLPVQEDGLLEKITKQPIIFEEASYTQNTLTESKSDFHLIVLVHGFQGNSFDLRTLRNYISLVYPKVLFLESTFNESKTEGDIREMGSRLSRELISHLTYNFPDKSPKISFIGHSLGGLIIRAALPYLDCLSDRMHLFMSLSTPHLGLMYPSKILDAGIWLLKRMKKSKSIKQLCFEDYSKIQGTCLFMLSKEEGLQWFKFVALVGSLKDDYAPFDSARIEVPAKASKDPERGNFYIQMAHNILQKLTRQNIVKLDVHFKLKKSLETMIGRSAHLQILENENFLKILVFHYPEFFT
jgi:pimeloyl-ACP methyl ester carboxylesterase